MFAQVVFDLPLEKSFDYSVPLNLEKDLTVGMCVHATLGPKRVSGIVTKISDQSDFENLKSLKLIDTQYSPLDSAQISLASKISIYYGCSLGQALFAIARGSQGQLILQSRSAKSISHKALYMVPGESYCETIEELIHPLAQDKKRLLILVPDQGYVSILEERLKKYLLSETIVIGTRSMVFRSFLDISLVIMIDENNSSYKQEQTPMYETRDVLLMRAAQEYVDIVFVSTTPTVELMDLVNKKEVLLQSPPNATQVRAQIVDLTNYNIIWKGILSPAVMSSVESNILKKFPSILVFNHRGSFAITRCPECNFVLKCERCDSPMTYSRIKKQYLCRHCSFHFPGDKLCPNCRKPSWKSFGLGVEQLQKALKEKYPLARISAFERGMEEPPENFDIIIGTVALLRFKMFMKAKFVALLDIDSELNRLDARSCFRAFALAQDFRNMAQEQFLIQTRNPHHYVIDSLMKGNPELFYLEDMKVRHEFGFSPFGHQVLIQMRHKTQAAVEKKAQELFIVLKEGMSPEMQVHAPAIEATTKKRDLFRVNILLQGKDVAGMITFIKEAFKKLKRSPQVITTFNVDP